MSTAALRTPPEAAARPRTALQPSPCPAPRRLGSRVAVGVTLLVIVGAFAARCFDVARRDSITSDETTHLVHVFHGLRNGDDLAMWELGAPKLPHLLGGAASYAALRAVGIFDRPCDVGAVTEVVLSGMPRVLLPARLVAIGWGAALLLLVFWATARRGGAALGLIAAGLVSLVPECLAHASIAGSDMPFTASAFLALILLARYVEAPSPGRWAAVGLGIGLAWAMRHTALLLLILAGPVHLIVTLRKPRARGIGPLAEAIASSGLANIAAGLLAFAVLWAGDGFGTVTLGEVAGRSTSGVPRMVGPIDAAKLPIPTSAVSVLKQVRHQNAGHEAYLCGEIRQSGWPAYFPIAFGLKTPTGLLALFVLAIARSRPSLRPSAWDAVALAFLGLLWLMLVRNKVNIGVRYALLTYPIAIPFVARMFAADRWRDRVWGPIALAAVAWFAWASFGASGRFLSSFNEVGGGPRSGWMYLADSNLDWGQDFDALGHTLRRRGIREVTVDVSTERRMAVPGIYAPCNPPKAFQVPAAVPPNRRLWDSDGGYIPVYTRYFAISASRLMGLYSQNDVSWLRTRRLIERVGDSIFLFDLDEPADRPF